MKKGIFSKIKLTQLLPAIGLIVLAGHLTFASGETITASNSFTTQIKTATPINDLVINGTGNDTVPVKLLVTNGTLAMSTTTGLTFTGQQTGSTLYFSGTRSNVNAALATLTYTRNTLGSDTLEVSLVNPGEVFFAGTNHLYEYVSSTLTWGGAKTAAEGRSKYGATGYLTTITSQAENDFVSARLTNAGWMGASDVSSESVWKWVTGPESGTTFSNGNSPNMVVANGQYQNWNGGEPNDSGSNEDCGQFLAGSSGLWNDLPCSGTTLPGYVVEYGAPGNMPSVAAKNISLTTSDTVAPTTPGAPSTTTPTATQKPSWSWSSATDAGVGLANPAYTVEWSQSSTFASSITSATTNNTSYTHAANLADGTWYFRVKASDTSGNFSAYSSTSNVVIDSTPPSAPDLSGTTIKTHNQAPTISWNSAVDTGTGLANPAYTVQRSQSSTFASGITSATTNSNFFTTSSLSDGTWYLRVRAVDQVSNTSTWSPTITIIVDTAAPTVPGTPSTATPTNNKKPSWTWVASSDIGTGLRSPAYTVQWSQSSSFSSGVSSATTNSTSFTHSANLTDGTWYFRVQATDDAANDSGFTANGSVTIDTTLAAISAILASSNGNTGQTVTWTTDKLSSSKILYGPTNTYGSSTAEADTSPRVTNHSMQLSGLVACTLYHYQLVSVDALGNQTDSADMSFITSGCAGAAAVTSHTDTVITAGSGGNVTLPVGANAVTLSIPANFSSFDADFQIKQIDTAAALSVIGSPTNLQPAGKAYDLKAMKDTVTPISSFAHEVSVTLPYEPAEIAGLIESSLVIYRWDSGIGWQRLNNCQINTSARTVTCSTPGFSTFVLFGTLKPVIAAPAKSVAISGRGKPSAHPKQVTANVAADTTAASTQLRLSQSAGSGGSKGGVVAAGKVPRETDSADYHTYWGIGALVISALFLLLAFKRRKKEDTQSELDAATKN